MATRVHLLRPDDLLNLVADGVNLRLDTSSGAEPALVVDDAAQPAYLVLHFPPQSIVEEAYYQPSPKQPPPDEAAKPFNAKPPAANLQAPVGLARARVGGPSRLVFRVPAGRRIPYTTEGLLDWSDLELSVSALADLPETPTPEQALHAPAIAPPEPHETAIELPYRLVLSPTHAVAWLHARGPKTHAGRTELWHTRLALRDAAGLPVPTSRLDPAPLRAIWSPDYAPTRFAESDPPRFGLPDLDWDHPPGVLTAMTPSDRHELVILTSAFRGFVKGYVDYPHIDYDRYEPKPVHAEQLILSALGGWLKSRGAWQPPMHWRFRFRPEAAEPRRQLDALVRFIARAPHERVVAPDPRPPPAAPFAPGALRLTRTAAVGAAREDVLQRLRGPEFPFLGELGASLNISEWTHLATQGRDHYVRIVYEGVVFPCRHRASLVKVTERKISSGKNGAPVAYLAQRMFVVIRQPEVDYDAERSADPRYGRQMMLRRIRLKTLVTPDIDAPVPVSGPFKIQVGGAALRFDAVGTDVGGRDVCFDTALFFVPFGSLSSATIASVRTQHLDWPERACPVSGQPVTFAERKGAPGPGGREADNTTLTTHALHLTADPIGEGATASFRPLLFKAEVRLPAVEQLLGTDAPTEIAFEDDYLAHGFDGANRTGLFARIVKESATATHDLVAHKVQAELAAEQAGGIATPDLSISGLTRELGPLAGNDLGRLRSNDFDPAAFFEDVKNAAKLFGTIPLVDLLTGGTMDEGAPKVELATEPVPGSPTKRKLTATLRFEPKVRPAKVGIVSLAPGPNARLAIGGRVERIVEVPAAGPPGPATSAFDGELSDFTIELLNVVAVFFRAFRFASHSGRKPEVSVALRDPDPIAFRGDLSFVNELRKFIPPGLFGDGASLDVDARRVKAGFGIGLPAVAIGVFSLSGVSLRASVELPFLDGKPLFDFGVSSREHPFCLTVAFLGGGGFFHLQVDTEGVRMLEAALEFGAAISVNLGVASGGVHVMAGIYFAMGKKDGQDFAVLAGYLRMGGELSVLGLISLSLEFMLSFAYEDGKAAGRATLTVKIEILFFSTSVEITVEKRFGGSSGDPRFFQVFETPAVWHEYASAFA